METQAVQLRHNHQGFVNRFAAACQADERVVAAFLGGSYVKGMADAYSDLDLSLITTDAAYAEFCATREAFLRLLGEPVFVEDFDNPNIVFFIYPDDTEGELWFGSVSHLEHLHCGPYRVLLDKTGILAGVVFPEPEADPAGQRETLRRQITWFWHDLSHFITAMRRGQLWWAHGQLNDLRHSCMNLARLGHTFTAHAEGYEKVEQALPAAHLAPLHATYCPLERGAMLEAAYIILRFYQDLAPRLARMHGLAYPDALEYVMIERLTHMLNIAPTRRQ